MEKVLQKQLKKYNRSRTLQKFLKTVLLTLACGVTTLSAYHNAQINLNNTDIEGRLNFDMGQFNENVDPETTYIGLRYLHGERSQSLLGNSNGLFEVNFLLKGNLPSFEDLNLGLGVKFDGISVDSKTNGVSDTLFMALPVGIHATYHLPVPMVPIYLGAEAYYAPEVLSFYDANNYKEYNAHLDVEVIPRAKLTVGYRWIDLNYSVNYTKAIYGGLSFSF
jgi:hypothetical protein